MGVRCHHVRLGKADGNCAATPARGFCSPGARVESRAHGGIDVEPLPPCPVTSTCAVPRSLKADRVGIAMPLRIAGFCLGIGCRPLSRRRKLSLMQTRDRDASGRQA
jgi:hypothetical protein